MKVKRCPQYCHDSHCPTCTGTGYVHTDGTSATPEEMLEQLTRGMYGCRRVRFEERVDNQMDEMERESEEYYERLEE